jgi:cyclopropane-fatty-acyl-phospholipid synthase
MSLAQVVEKVLGPDLPVSVQGYDGTSVGDPDARTRIVIRSPQALRRIVTAPGELGMARAYVAGDLDLEGSVWDLLALRDRLPEARLDRAALRGLVHELGGWSQVRPVPAPPEEVVLRGRRHSRARDARAISHHYDVSNAFYRVVLGPSLTYSCAVFRDPSDTLEDAQANKYELVCRKLGLRPGMRLLDIGCGWGGMVLHAAREHGVEAVGVTLSRQQADLAAKRVAEAGLSGRVEVRIQDYRDITDGPFDAVSSIGMFEHVGEARLTEYFAQVAALVAEGGRLLNHAISRPAGQGIRLPRRSFANRYVFPDGELHEVGDVVSRVQAAGFEARHVESLREHYALTLRRWVDNLEAGWDEAVAEVGEGRARVWRLYMAGSASNFAANRSQVHQVLAVKTGADGRSGLPLRPSFD